MAKNQDIIAKASADRIASRRTRLTPAVAAILCLVVVPLAACTPQIDRRGHIMAPDDIAQVKSGMSKDQVRLLLGTPDTQSAIGGGSFYYMSSTQKSVAFFKPTEIDRKVLAVYFDPNDSVKQVVNYGIKDGKLFDFITRTTPSHGSDINVLKQIFGNLGKRVTPF